MQPRATELITALSFALSAATLQEKHQSTIFKTIELSQYIHPAIASKAVAKKAKKKAFSLTLASSETFSCGKSMMEERFRRLENLPYEYLPHKYGNLVAHLQKRDLSRIDASETLRIRRYVRRVI